MPQRALIYRVLVASPSDCSAERRIVPDTLRAWNAAHSLDTGAILEPVLWETHARPELGDRPQALINRQLVDHCDLLVGTFWTRLGTSTGKAESGTAEEIEEFRAKGKPVLLYFSSAPVVPSSLDAAQYSALLDYKKKLQPHGLYFEYETPELFERMLQRHIASTMAKQHSGVPVGEDSERGGDSSRDLATLCDDFDSFLRRVRAEWVSERDSGPHGIEEGKAVLQSAFDDVVSFRQQIVSGLDDVCAKLESVAADLRRIQRHQLFLDGGRSTMAFWESGDLLIAELDQVAALLRKHSDGAAV
jgi:hypothetical protein